MIVNLVLLGLCLASLAAATGPVSVDVHGSGDDGVEFNAFGKRFSVRPSEDDVITVNDVPVYTVNGNALKKVEIANDTKIYATKSSAMAVKRGDNPTVNGWMIDGDEVYRITPDGTAKRSDTGGNHKVEVMEEKASDGHDYIDPHVSAAVDRKKAKRGYRHSSYSKLNAIVELLVIVDNSIFRRVMQQTRNDEMAAMRELKIYYTLYVASINQRFQNIDDPELSITIVASAIVIDRDRASAPWAEYHAYHGADGMVLDAMIALDKFREWIMSELPRLPQFDHAMGLTDYDLIRRGSVNTMGMAYVNTMCDLTHGFSVSIMQENGGFASAGAATHELGHSLGARHDGDKENRDCPPNMNNVMAPGNSNDKRVLKNFFYFSRCSIRQMKKAIRNESSECLFNTRRSSARFRRIRLPGQIIDVNKQCQQIIGPKSSFCGEERFIKEMCFRLWCREPGTGLCKTHGAMVAAYGTTCGEKKWCVNGDCVFDHDAPRMAACHFGEVEKGRCQRLIREDIAHCRDEKTKKICCESCPKMMRMYYRL